MAGGSIRSDPHLLMRDKGPENPNNSLICALLDMMSADQVFCVATSESISKVQSGTSRQPGSLQSLKRWFSRAPGFAALALALNVLVRLSDGGANSSRYSRSKSHRYCVKAIDVGREQLKTLKIHGPSTRHALIANREDLAGGLLRCCSDCCSARVRSEDSCRRSARTSRAAPIAGSQAG